jgi:hypothetical protein
MPSIRLVPLLVCGLWPTLGLAQNVHEIDRAVASVVHVCLADGRTEAVIGGPTDAFELSLRSIDSEGNIRAELNISASNADRFQARVANAIARLTSDKAAKVGACLEPVYARLKEVASSSAPIRNRGSPPLALPGHNPSPAWRHPTNRPSVATAPPSTAQPAATPPSTAQPDAAPPRASQPVAAPSDEPRTAPGQAGEPQSELDRMRKIRQELERLPKGKIHLSAPSEMKVADRRNVDARVGVNVTDEVLKGRIRAGDQSIEAPLRVSHEMVATLSGPGFAITPITPGKQTVAEGFTTVWEWEVEAKVQGTQELEATLYALVPDSASTTAQQRIDSYMQKINVSVKPQTWGEWLTSAREEIDTVKAIVIALASSATLALGWLGISLKRKKRATAKKTRLHPKGPRGRRARSGQVGSLVAEDIVAVPRAPEMEIQQLPDSPRV